jgi:C-terminal processing protease CtpA/Prc
MLTGYVAADTISMKDGKELKGIVIEDYKDRILFSTADGQKIIMKSDMKELYFDTEEQNLIKLAEQSRDRGDYSKAYTYYDKAFKLNPQSRVAKDGMVFLQGYLFKKDVSEKEELVRRHNEFEHRGEGLGIKSEEEKFSEDLNKLRLDAGIELATSAGITRIDSVSPESPAGEAGILKGDTLVAIWGKLVGYIPLEEVTETLLEKNSLETKIELDRNINVNVESDGSIGATLVIKFDGLTVFAVKDGSGAFMAGLEPNDLIMQINGESTRFMPLKRANEIIKGSKGGQVNLTVRKEVIMWGKGGE